jgi:hypothetical protein
MLFIRLSANDLLQVKYIFHNCPEAYVWEFETHHRKGRTSESNIHSSRNLLALCHTCHLDFDNDEGIFLPNNVRTMLNQMVAEPQKDLICDYNSERDIVYRRILIQPDPDSPAYKKASYRSAFTSRPEKPWTGEVGLVILRTSAISQLSRDFLEDAKNDAWIIQSTREYLAWVWESMRCCFLSDMPTEAARGWR